MARIKINGVVEAVRYDSNGRIDKVRIYENRWLVFSDAVLIDRAALVDRLVKGQVLVTGKRKPYVANVFEIGKQVHLSGKVDPLVTTKDHAGSQDFLANVPAF